MTAPPAGAHRGAGHIPVMTAEVVRLLAPRDGEVILDGTFGAGGHSQALLAAADCTVWAMDRDPDAIARATAIADTAPVAPPPVAPSRAATGAPGTPARRLRPLQARFGDMVHALAGQGVTALDGVLLDLGVSSPQLDTAARGFSFRRDGPLDMRMDRSGRTAADLVNGATEQELADTVHALGEEPRARRIARRIVAARRAAPITTTTALADIVRAACGGRRTATDPATRTFQALRMWVNDEAGELGRGLAAAETLLRAGGRLVVIAFHSLEDRKVKLFLRRRSDRAPAPSRHRPAPVRPDPGFRLLTRRALTAGRAELAANPRARSARLRAAERLAAPAWPAETG